MAPSCRNFSVLATMFQQPGVLWGFLALAVPIIVHLLNFRQPRRVLFSQLSFVKAVNQVVVRRMQLKRWLLLALRLLAIAFLVLAFAGPIWRKNGATSVSQRSVVLVLDNSLSMTWNDESGQLLEQARETGRSLIKSFDANDEFLVLATSNLRYASGFVPQREALAKLEEIRIGRTTRSLSDVLERAPKLFEGAANTSRNLFVLSDFQQSTLLADSLSARLDSSITTQLIPLGGGAPNNLYVSDLALTDPVLEPGEPIKLQFTIHNDAPLDNPLVSVRIRLNGEVVALASEAVPAGATKRAEVSFKPTKAGWQQGEVLLEDSPVDFDNIRYFALQVPDASRILFVEGDRTSKYLQLLLKQLTTRFKTTSIRDKALANANLADYDAVVLAGVPNLPSGLRDRLDGWIEEGGGLLVFPAETPNLPDWNTFYGSLGLGSFREVQRLDPLVGVNRPDLQHPIFRGVYQTTDAKATFDGPSIGRIWPFAPGSRRVQSTVVSTTQGMPLLHEARVGAGGVITCTVFPDLPWSDFPIKSSFVPVIYRSLVVLAGENDPRLEETIGDAQPRKVGTTLRELVRLVGSDGLEIIPEQTEQQGGITLKFDASELLPGTYRVLQNDSLLQTIAFNLAGNESQLTRASEGELTTWLNQQGIGPEVSVLAAKPETIQTVVAANLLGTQLWQLCLVLALLMVVGEILVARFLK